MSVFFYNEVDTFIQQGSKFTDIYNVTKYFDFK